ncbi:hypothetical protein ACTP13_19530 [Paenibacillus peoriae]|uniref:hypothetical protein n=1 Tax=Paenibacillus peoriae TaxID=59893 RepID=UPI003F963802
MSLAKVFIHSYVSELEEIQEYIDQIDIWQKAMQRENFKNSLLDSLDSMGYDKKDLEGLVNEHLDSSDWYSGGFREAFPQILIKSLFLSAYSCLEVCLTEVSEIIQKEQNLLIKPDDFRGSGVLRALLYLKKVVLLPILSDHEMEMDIRALNKLRNFYAHDGKNHIKAKSPVHQAAERFGIVQDSTIEIFGIVQIYLDKEFLNKAIYTIKLLLTYIGEGIIDKYMTPRRSH